MDLISVPPGEAALGRMCVGDVRQNTEYPFDGTQLSKKKERATGDNKKESQMHSAK